MSGVWLGFGEMRIVVGGKTARYYVDGGFAASLGRRDQRAHESHPAGRRARSQRQAQSQLEKAPSHPASGDEAIAIRDPAVDQARARLRVARRTDG